MPTHPSLREQEEMHRSQRETCAWDTCAPTWASKCSAKPADGLVLRGKADFSENFLSSKARFSLGIGALIHFFLPPYKVRTQ